MAPSAPRRFSVVVTDWLRKLVRPSSANADPTSRKNEATDWEALIQEMPSWLYEGRVFVEWCVSEGGCSYDSHADAHGQRREPPDGVFSVGGHSLRFPGDTGLGAPIADTIRCNCYLRTISITPDGAEEIVEDGILNPPAPKRDLIWPPPNPNAFTRIRPTSTFTFGYGKGPWRGKIVLGNLEVANYTVRLDEVTIRVSRRTIAKASLKRASTMHWTLGRVDVVDGYPEAGIRELLEASVAASNGLVDRWNS